MFSPIKNGKGKLSGFFFKMRSVPFKKWTSIQCWIAVLLIGLLVFNDPLFLVEVYSKAALPLAAAYIVFLTGYMALLMFFWLCIMHDTAR